MKSCCSVANYQLQSNATAVILNARYKNDKNSKKLFILIIIVFFYDHTYSIIIIKAYIN